MKYIDAEELIAEIERYENMAVDAYNPLGEDADFFHGKVVACEDLKELATSLQQEQPMPDSTKLIELWHEDKEMLKEKDFRDDPWRLAYNAFLCGFVRGIAVNKQEQEDTGWISVKDRLPEVGHFVLTCVSDTGTPQCVGMALLLEDRTWWDGDMKVRVDYWMEVPKFNNEKK